ncbi:retinoschisin-like [Pocillopora verrucosa]|uniref:retinoschisin-like n=1 Tax=Pocillopora verrucosa TaxID=203993 RepID=UPI00334151EF
MNFALCAELIVLLMFEVVASQAFVCKKASLSCPVITYNHRRLKGFTFKTIHLASLISCGLLCQRNPRCVSTNFRKAFKSEGTCELNDRGVLLTGKGNELEYNEEAIYTQFYDTKYHCQAFKEDLKVNCKCAESPKAPVPLGMESGAIFDSQITASSVYNDNLAASNARLHFKGSENPLRRAGWVAGVKNTNQWLQVDLQQTTRVMGIATQGRHDFDQWVTKYKLQYGDDGQTFRVYKRNGDISDTVFPGNEDKATVVYHDLNPLIYVRYVRVIPMEWKGTIAMRIELYSC